MIYKTMPDDFKRIKERYAYTCEYVLDTIKSGVQQDISKVITITSNKKMSNEEIHRSINEMLGIQIDDRQTGYDNYDVVQLKSSSVAFAYDKNIK